MFTQKQIEAAAEYLKKNQHLLSWSELAKSALEAAEAEAWEPIDSAPKDGTDIWLGRSGTDNGRLIGFWYRPWGTWNYYSPGKLGFTPTHWRPIPPAPQA